MSSSDSTFSIDATLRRLARPQLGLVTLSQISAHGIESTAIRRRRANGAVHEVFEGVLRLDAAPVTPEQLTLAAALAVRGAVVAASSAAMTIGMPVSVPTMPIVTTGRTRSARTTGLVTVRSQIVLPSRPWYTARIATPEATLVMLPRFEAAETVERCLDHCLAHRLTTIERVRGLIGSLPPRAVVGRRLLLSLVDARADGMGHRSTVERQVGRWLDAEGLRGWKRNHPVPVADGNPIEVDFAWPDAKVALEVSPFFTHGSRAAQERDIERRRALVAEGWASIEAADPDLVHRTSFEVIARSIRRALATSVRWAARRACERTRRPVGRRESPGTASWPGIRSGHGSTLPIRRADRAVRRC